MVVEDRRNLVNDQNQSGDIQFYYAPGAASSTTLTIDVDTNYSDQFSADQSNLVLYDVTGADPISPYCGARSTASDDQTSDTTTDGTTITPCSAGGLIFLQMARATNTAIGITPGYLDSATVIPMNQDSRVDQNNGFAHDNAVDTVPHQYTWTGDAFPDGWAATSVAFR
jgi:hypothetical protein